jgi:protein gp37
VAVVDDRRLDEGEEVAVMGEHSKIEWTDDTFNPWIGCTKVSPGCDHCYAERDWDHRFHKVKWGPHGERIRTTFDYWKGPLTWNRKAKAAGVRHRVFCASLADVFDNQVPEQWRSDLFDLIKATPELDWLLLTKRPQNIAKMFPAQWWPNVWIGTTCEDQKHYDQRWPLLNAVRNVPVRFISYAPAIGPLYLDEPVDWIICGGESGGGARMMNPQWARALRDQCAAANVPFFMKQMTGKKPIPDDLMVRQFPILPYARKS